MLKSNGNTENNLSELLTQAADNVLRIAENNPVSDKAYINEEGVTVIPICEVSIGLAGGGYNGKDNSGKSKPLGVGAKVTRKPKTILIVDGDKIKVKSTSENGTSFDALGLVKKIIKK